MTSSASSATSSPARLQLTTGRSYGYGYGFVHYDTEEAAKQAIECVDGMQIGEETVQITQLHRRRERDRPEYMHLYIKSLPDEWGEEQLNVEFSAFGTVTLMAAREGDKGGTGRNILLSISTSEEAHTCVEYHVEPT